MSLRASPGSVILPRAWPQPSGPAGSAPLHGPTQRALCAAGWQAKCLWNVSAACGVWGETANEMLSVVWVHLSHYSLTHGVCCVTGQSLF